MSLHQLGTSSDKLPPDDPMYPPNNPLLRRQLAVRVFTAVVSYDAIHSYHRAQYRGEHIAYNFQDGKLIVLVVRGTSRQLSIRRC